MMNQVVIVAMCLASLGPMFHYVLNVDPNL